MMIRKMRRKKTRKRKLNMDGDSAARSPIKFISKLLQNIFQSDRDRQTEVDTQTEANRQPYTQRQRQTFSDRD